MNSVETGVSKHRTLAMYKCKAIISRKFKNIRKSKEVFRKIRKNITYYFLFYFINHAIQNYGLKYRYKYELIFNHITIAPSDLIQGFIIFLSYGNYMWVNMSFFMPIKV